MAEDPKIARHAAWNERQIDIYSAHLADAIFAGSYRSVFKGQGMEFEEVRPYIPGDDVRAIDWNVTARLQMPYIKRFREERQLPMMFLVDISPTTLMRGPTHAKRELFAEVAALLAFAAIKNRDRIGAILFSDKIERVIPSRGDARHVERIIHSILNAPTIPFPQGQSDLSKPLHLLNHLHKRKTICFILTDHFIKLPHHEVTRTSSHHDLIFINVYSPFETHSSLTGLSQFLDLESQTKHWIDTTHPKRRQQLESNWLEIQAKLAQDLRLSRASQIELSTEEPAHEGLYRFFQNRRRRL